MLSEQTSTWHWWISLCSNLESTWLCRTWCITVTNSAGFSLLACTVWFIVEGNTSVCGSHIGGTLAASASCSCVRGPLTKPHYKFSLYTGSCKVPTSKHFTDIIYQIISLLEEFEEIELCCHHRTRRQKPLLTYTLSPFALASRVPSLPFSMLWRCGSCSIVTDIPNSRCSSLERKGMWPSDRKF